MFTKNVNKSCTHYHNLLV